MGYFNKFLDCSTMQPPATKAGRAQTSVSGLGNVTGSWVSPVFPVNTVNSVGIQVVANGAISGSLSLKVSCDPGLPPNYNELGALGGADQFNCTGSAQSGGFFPPGNFINWSTIATASVAPGSPAYIVTNDFAGRAMYVSFVQTGGTGSMGLGIYTQGNLAGQ